MPDGSRSRTGCITCRIRRKKCDEQRPICWACHSRQLACYGYSEPAPDWFTNKATWAEVRDSEDAKHLQNIAETRYKIRRKVGLRDGKLSAQKIRAQSCLEGGQVRTNPVSWSSLAIRMSPSSRIHVVGANIWQLRPESIWWDSKIRSLTSDPGFSSREETRLLMLFLDVIHPITHTFYKLEFSRDRSWMLDRLVSNEALHSSALSVSACFDHSLTQPPRINEIGMCSKVRHLQSRAVRHLQSEIDKFVMMECPPLEDFIWTGMQLLDVVSHLETLEIFSMLAGDWEMHHRGARRILNHVETCALPTLNDDLAPKASRVETALSKWLPGDDRRRSLEFCISNFIWIDVLAISTFGLLSYAPCAFDYVGLLQSGVIKPQLIMGCQGWIMAIVVEIARLEQLKVTLTNHMRGSCTIADLLRIGKQIAGELHRGIAKLEGDYNCSEESVLDQDIKLISIIWAYGAQVLLQATILEPESTARDIDQTIVNRCLQKLEELPTRLVMRTSWPYTIAGCMSSSDAQHQRFRRVLGRTMQEAQPPGIAWKGLIVMEECWKLRQKECDRRIGWREAMDSLGARVILT
ncbi:hypothetical protein MMC25_000659 [Agyrium rufum]|nr:hypothetical protein [Agyrium rufum]